LAAAMSRDGTADAKQLARESRGMHNPAGPQ
jgi:hypothetical protein